ncbi:MAG: molybdopterin molybdotransferase MoeA [Chloroflexi bacterium]|nr:molybdopterin molybdotransferase MoeA [Chloroflexota bacterium]
MLSVEEARERVLALVPVLEAETRPLLETLGQVLAEDLRAGLDIPPLDNSAMDGYAVRHQDLLGASADHPVEFQVIGSVAAGQLPHHKVKPGTAIRIMTGAPIPPGADAVVPFEETDELERQRSARPLDTVAVRGEVPPGANVRRAGEDVQRGQVVLPRGTVLRPSEIGVLASVGMATVQVVRRPIIAVLATGDELLEPGQRLEPGKIYNSNGYSIAASVVRYGGVPRVLGIARDNLESLTNKLEEGLAADMLITTAGVSKGDYDMVKDVLVQRGEIAFWSVRMRPAKPLAFGTLRGPGGRPVPHLGLPGNPVSAMVAFEELARPALLKMLGRKNLEKPTIEAVLADRIVNTDGRRVYARAVVTNRDGTYYAHLTGPQGSNILTSMARANGLAICPEDVPVLEKGERVQVRMLDWSEESVY